MSAMTGQWFTIMRDVDAILIPAGTPIFLRAGEQVLITQALGDTYTVQVGGNLARIEGNDADALGLVPPSKKTFKTHNPLVGDGEVDEALVWEQLRSCYDPEIPVNIVDLGLIYTCDILKDKENHVKVYIEMTLTAIGCGMGPFLVADVQHRVAQVPNVSEVQVELVFDPPWDQSMMSEAAQLQLGLL